MTFTSGLPPAGAPVSGMPTPVPVAPPGPTYLMTCPNCGRPLHPVVLDPHTCPWLCDVCALGFWVSELEHARLWDPVYRCFGSAGLRDRLLAVAGEVEDARVRGVSVRPDQLGLLDVDVLNSLLSRMRKMFPPVVPPTPRPAGWVAPAPPPFVALVEAAVAAKAGK